MHLGARNTWLPFHGTLGSTCGGSDDPPRRNNQDQKDWTERNNAYLERHRKASEQVDELEAIKRERLGKGKIIEGFIKDIENRSLAIAEFDEKLWLAVIDQVTVDQDGALTFRFKNGSEVIEGHHN